MKIVPCLSPWTKFKSKWIKDLNIKPIIQKLIEEKVGSTLECISIGDLFLNITPIAQTLKTTINKWNLIKPRSFCKAKNMINETRQQPTEWEEIFYQPNIEKMVDLKNIKRTQEIGHQKNK